MLRWAIQFHHYATCFVVKIFGLDGVEDFPFFTLLLTGKLVLSRDFFVAIGHIT